MKTNLLFLSLILAGPLLEAAQIQLEVPGFGSTANAIPFFAGASERYQQVYGASDFGVIGQGGGFVTSIAFRFADPHTLGGNLPNLQINMSTTVRPVDGLSATFAQNLGPDDTKVFGVAGVDWANDPTLLFPAFINLSTPFFYNPANGNLLVDMHVFQTGQVLGMGGSLSMVGNLANNDSISAVYGVTVNDSVGTTTTGGLDTLFTVTPVPEPSTYAFAGLATVMLLVRRYIQRKTSKRKGKETWH